MAHVDIALRPPSYGWRDENGALVKPTTKQLLAEFADRINVFKSRKQWLPFSGWFTVLCMGPFIAAFAMYYFSWWLVLAGFLYSMVCMGSHGTVWYHRYGTHKAFSFTHPIFRMITRNLVIKMVPEEIYIVSHVVHHARSERAGDPYNPKAGPLYCFLADAIHQPIAQDLSEEDYTKACNYLAHTGITMNTYEQYQTWGSIANPLHFWVHQLMNWTMWYAAFFLIGGHALATAMFASASVWAVGVRTFNYGAHGGGQDQQQDGEDFYRKDLSINQFWPGLVSGEWHNNHHLFPRSARAGFKWWQVDIPWMYVSLLKLVGGVSDIIDRKPQYMRKHYEPWLASIAAAETKSK